MAYLIICCAALVGSLLAFLSGFGLGTVLLPFFALFFPLAAAVALTAVVHLANNLFKFGLMGKFARLDIVIRFGIPAALTTALGAFLLNYFSSYPPLFSYELFNNVFQITYLGLIIGALLMISSLFELVPFLSSFTFPAWAIPIGGALSGFFGGISGNQGILRSAFLIKSDLSKEEFIGTTTACSLIVDLIRLPIYGFGLFYTHIANLQGALGIVVAALFTAFLGSLIGLKLLRQITPLSFRYSVGILIFLFGAAIFGGLTSYSTQHVV